MFLEGSKLSLSICSSIAGPVGLHTFIPMVVIPAEKIPIPTIEALTTPISTTPRETTPMGTIPIEMYPSGAIPNAIFLGLLPQWFGPLDGCSDLFVTVIPRTSGCGDGHDYHHPCVFHDRHASRKASTYLPSYEHQHS